MVNLQTMVFSERHARPKRIRNRCSELLRTGLGETDNRTEDHCVAGQLLALAVSRRAAKKVL